MKETMKKVIAFALAAVMMIPVCGIGAKAASSTETVYGTCDAGYVRADHDLDYNFEVTIPDGTKVTSAILYIERKAHYPSWDQIMAVGVKKDSEFTQIQEVWYGVTNPDGSTTAIVDAYSHIAVDVAGYITSGQNTFALTYTGTSGVDYYTVDDAAEENQKPRLVITYEAPTYYNLTIDGTTYKAEKDAKVTVEDTDTENFAYWAKNGYIVSFDPVYSFYAYENVTELNAVHKDEAIAGYENISGLVYVTSAQSGDTGVDVVVEYWQSSDRWVGGYFGKTVNPGWGSSKMVEVGNKLVGEVGQYKVSVSNAVGNDLFFNIEAGGSKVNPSEALVLGKSYGSNAAQ